VSPRGLPPGGPLRLQWRPFRFRLPRELVTAHGALRQRAGWLLRLEAADGRIGWGEAAPLDPDAGVVSAHGSAQASARQEACGDAIAALGAITSLEELERAIPLLPAVIGFALGSALAELQGLVGAAAGGWLEAPTSAWLLPAGEAALSELEGILASAALAPIAAQVLPSAGPLTVKWKVAACSDPLERELLERVLLLLPADARLRLDANGGWDRPTAAAWAERLAGEPRLEWLEQPLAAADLEGLSALAQRLPVALDESLALDPALRLRWGGWQVRRPALEGDPRPLIAALAEGRPRWMVSTALETGSGRRLVAHAAALQWRGPTPTAPGLAPQWQPEGPLFAADPQVAWASLDGVAR